MRVRVLQRIVIFMRNVSCRTKFNTKLEIMRDARKAFTHRCIYMASNGTNRNTTHDYYFSRV